MPKDVIYKKSCLLAFTKDLQIFFFQYVGVSFIL